MFRVAGGAASGRPARPAPERGFHLLEVLVGMLAAGVLLTLTVPPLYQWTARLRTRSAAGELAGLLRRARSEAARRGTRVGVKFRVATDGTVSYTLHRDGDGDGLSTRDIDAGIDPALGPTRRLEHLGADIRFGFPPGPPPRDPADPSRRLDRLEDPLRFNRSDLVSFHPLGTSAPGSAYLTDGRRQLMVVRLFGRSGKVKILAYDAATESWRLE